MLKNIGISFVGNICGRVCGSKVKNSGWIDTELKIQYVCLVVKIF